MNPAFCKNAYFFSFPAHAQAFFIQLATRSWLGRGEVSFWSGEFFFSTRRPSCFISLSSSMWPGFMEKDLKRSWSYHWHCLRSITSDLFDGVLPFNSLRLWASQFLNHSWLVTFLSLVHSSRLVLLVKQFFFLSVQSVLCLQTFLCLWRTSWAQIAGRCGVDRLRLSDGGETISRNSRGGKREPLNFVWRVNTMTRNHQLKVANISIPYKFNDQGE